MSWRVALHCMRVPGASSSVPDSVAKYILIDITMVLTIQSLRSSVLSTFRGWERRAQDRPTRHSAWLKLPGLLDVKHAVQVGATARLRVVTGAGHAQVYRTVWTPCSQPVDCESGQGCAIISQLNPPSKAELILRPLSSSVHIGASA